MQETTGLLDQIRHHDKLALAVNENCAIPLPDDVLKTLFSPHKLSFYYLMYVHQGSASFKADMEEIRLTDGQLVFGLPNQIFTNMPFGAGDQHYAVSFDEQTLALLPHAYAFLVNPFASNTITFDSDARERVQVLFSTLFKLLHTPGKQRNAEIILAHLHTLLTEINSAYFQQGGAEMLPNSKLSKYVAFKVAVETHLTEQQDVHSIAAKLAMTTGNLYGIVKEFSGFSPKEWITHRLMQEARRKLHYAPVPVKELAYELGFNDPDYFSRLFKKSTGKSVSAFLEDLRDLSSN
ncbi:helix-turn-helix domain-containing protein [Dyadobacter sandarakinus]|uniref:Helix-turn-helix domain-containing protein n=1 Tax=Dyadobacter sandarakinus TaxID=2747268 RepID=A0ABX7I2C9_9BACT|nr:AraC family transcriptional regulator [Dyadobacter sandarakinus]QRR00242.1 helix-turn-helix domain-containing protein [Dyadobacter sandarakinus]